MKNASPAPTHLFTGLFRRYPGWYAADAVRQRMGLQPWDVTYLFGGFQNGVIMVPR